jgi:hypothetical protein
MKTRWLSIAAATFIPLIATATQIPVKDFWLTGQGEWNLYKSGVVNGSGSGIMEYLYGVGNFTRLDDSALKLWTSAGAPAVGVDAVYAGAQQNLYTADPSGAPVSPILSPAGNIGGLPVRFLNTTSFTPVSDPFLFLDRVPGYNDAYSDPAVNANLLTRMVAFSVGGYLATAGDANSFTAFGNPTFVLAFEDGDDWDFQDLVVEVNGVKPVPDGGMTIAMLGVAIAGLGLLRRKF